MLSGAAVATAGESFEGAAEAGGEGETVVDGAPLGNAEFLKGGAAGVGESDVAVGVEPEEGDGDEGEDGEGEADADGGDEEDGRDEGPEVPGGGVRFEGETRHDL
jgi:hypothetical protein